ncbi:hypothetical protein L226DRAFT_495610 [Lentinus tigrinus ALCF2SS1-7]|uniref:Uncharacterized protein n=1 Tax=Lentinus tigrinus ALCF2SS1-6 TaxID=1328759 RepID=A0A5C2RXL1_9APHY|nr:hypothetical protein L227DRAFT_579484 [Lentinus tigrinus ALCF2SS1-6]RPD68541.1 hypothetical protein L226DRAFT_495610 [Lentinus tigrinus ALCF2SS1-7]
MTTTLAQEHADKIFIAVTISPTSALNSDPDGLVVHPLITRLGRVGELQDVQLLGVPRDSWAHSQDDVMRSLSQLQGVLRVDVQDVPRLRTKRGGDEL